VGAFVRDVARVVARGLVAAFIYELLPDSEDRIAHCVTGAKKRFFRDLRGLEAASRPPLLS
jgi:hypothetical protein